MASSVESSFDKGGDSGDKSLVGPLDRSSSGNNSSFFHVGRRELGVEGESEEVKMCGRRGGGALSSMQERVPRPVELAHLKNSKQMKLKKL